MRVFHSILLICTTAFAYDAVLFSNEQKISKEYPTIDDLLSSASQESPIVFVSNPDFSLGQFSKQSAAYSTHNSVNAFVNLIKSSKYHAARYVEEPVEITDADVVASASDYKPGSSVYVISGEDWNSVESTVMEIVSQLPTSSVFIITSSDAVSVGKTRVKRVSSDDTESSSNSLAQVGDGSYQEMPLSIPPFNRTGGPAKPDADTNCLLYLEGLNIIVRSVINKGDVFVTIPIRSNDSEWVYNTGDVKCINGTVGDYDFKVNLRLKSAVQGKNFAGDSSASIDAGSVISFRMVLTGDNLGYWNLKQLIVGKIQIKGDGKNVQSASTTDGDNSTNVNFMGVNSIQGWAFGCGNSQAAFYRTDSDNTFIGISLYNTQIQPFGVYDAKKNAVYFTLNVDSCTGTFSTGSWMGIISILVLLAGLIFGYLMLNSVETMDRFDDPKQKQIVINVRE